MELPVLFFWSKMAVSWWLIGFGFFFVLFGGVIFLVEGFKGQVRWPKGAPHLNPPFFLFCFLFVLLFEEKTCSPLSEGLSQKGHFCLFFSVSLCVSLVFPLLVFTLSFSISLSLLVFLSSSRFYCFLVFHCFLVLVSLFICLVSLFLFHDKNNIKNVKQERFSSNLFVFGFLSCFVFHFPLSSLMFTYLKLCFLVNIFVFIFQNKLNTCFWWNWGLQKHF